MWFWQIWYTEEFTIVKKTKGIFLGPESSVNLEKAWMIFMTLERKHGKLSNNGSLRVLFYAQNICEWEAGKNFSIIEKLEATEKKKSSKNYLKAIKII